MLTENFRGSEWTDQEVGHALSRVADCLILSVMVAPITVPHGFLSPYTALKLDPKRVPDSCRSMVSVIDEKPGISEVRKTRAVDQFVSSNSFNAARTNVRALLTFDRFSRDQMDRVLTAAITNNQVYRAFNVSESLGTLVARHEASSDLRQRFLDIYRP